MKKNKTQMCLEKGVNLNLEKISPLPTPVVVGETGHQGSVEFEIILFKFSNLLFKKIFFNRVYSIWH